MFYLAGVVLGSVLVTGVGLAHVGAGDGASAYQQQIESWRRERVAHLTAPNGWLSLVALDWLKDGANTIGSAKGNDIMLAKAPPHLGTITLGHGKVNIVLDAKSGATIDGAQRASAELLDDSHEHPTLVAFGSVNFYLVQRGDKFGLRVKDSDAPSRTDFLGIDYFPIDPSWRIEAKWEAYNPPHQEEEANIIGQVDKVTIPGAATFDRNGKTYRVEPMIENPGDTVLFLVFADKTSGKETYGAARFLYADPPKDGKIILDFNKAYNPPCAFTPYATCPLPTAGNRLRMRVTAGEKKYRGGHE